ncbi:MAG: hypothetical protein HPY90_14100 [Syntrophothermus sp.]|uniref:hypothetical protein n=1 Tax=Syntrophothermus sp. TaxID=2736299 RepID=UPI00257957CD|nr:hypothetical protein [Syntrophothermus sp.]NSW84370.1 hypothetical protein [Syntrophothermus sp.]
MSEKAPRIVNFQAAETVYGFVTALTPIHHGEIPPYNVKPDTGEPVRFRRMPILAEDKLTGVQTRIDLPVISGNAVRGIGRRLLLGYTLKTLGIDKREKFNKLFATSDIASDIFFFLHNGGATHKNDTPDQLDMETYDRISRSFPIWSLLGGNYHGHMIEGQCRIGIMIPLVSETKSLISLLISKALVKQFDMEEKEWDSFELTASSLISEKASVVRYMRRAEKTEPKEEPAGKDDDKYGAVFGFEVIPAGTKFVQVNVLTDDSEMNRLAFRAMTAMISLRGVLGGQVAKGHGMAVIRYFDASGSQYTREDIDRYGVYLIENKSALLDALAEFAKKITYQKKKADNADGSKKKPDKKAAGTDSN